LLKWKTLATIAAREDTFLALTRKELAANKTKEVIHAQQILNQAADDNETIGSAHPSQPVPTRGNNDGVFSWSNFQKVSVMAQRAEYNMKDVILLDNQSKVDYFCNQNFVQEITPSMQTMILQTNAGNKLTSHKAKVPNYGGVWFDIEGMANIFSFAKMEDK